MAVIQDGCQSFTGVTTKPTVRFAFAMIRNEPLSLAGELSPLKAMYFERKPPNFRGDRQTQVGHLASRRLAPIQSPNPMI